MPGTYSLVNIATVVRDLSRRPAGGVLAGDLLHLLDLDPAAVAALDAHRPVASAPRHRCVLHAAVGARPRALDLLGTLRERSESAGLAAWTSSLDVLEQAPLGGGAELLRWVRDELLRTAWDRTGDVAVTLHPHALAVASDAALAGWADEPTTDQERVRAVAELRGPWRAFLAPRRAPVPADPAVRHVVDAVASADPAALHAAGAAMRSRRADGWSWAAAMHDACWAVELTGRGRAAATAQLAALRATLAVTGAPLMRAEVTAAVSAAVHATVVADVLAVPTVADMCAPLLAHV